MKYKNLTVVTLKTAYIQIKKTLLEKVDTEYTLELYEAKKKRSTEISTHFHSHITNIFKALRKHGLKVTRQEIYIRVLLLACEMETCEGAAPYPYTIIDRNVLIDGGLCVTVAPVLEPYRTSDCNNKQLMQAVEACHRFAADTVQEIYGLTEGIILPESEDEE